MEYMLIWFLTVANKLILPAMQNTIMQASSAKSFCSDCFVPNGFVKLMHLAQTGRKTVPLRIRLDEDGKFFI
jgi:hypothetical protein